MMNHLLLEIFVVGGHCCGCSVSDKIVYSLESFAYLSSQAQTKNKTLLLNRHLFSNPIT